MSKRQMSPHVCSRVYRAPEIILMQKQYDGSVDIWSLGCVLAELLATCESRLNAKDGVSVQTHLTRRLLFNSDSCYPLSPKQLKKKDVQVMFNDYKSGIKGVSQYDQLILVN